MKRCAVLTLMFAMTGCIAGQRAEGFEQRWDRALHPDPARAVGADLDAPQSPSAKPREEAAANGDPRTGDGANGLSVSEALLRAVENNPSLAAQRLAPLVRSAEEQAQRGLFDPELFASVNYQRGSASQTTDVTGERFVVNSNADALRLGVRQFLPTGTQVEVSASRERTDSSRRPEQFQTRAGLTVTQSLLRGLGPDVNLAVVRDAELSTLASAWELRGFTEALLAETERAYWQLLLASRKIEIVERSLAVTQQRLSEVEAFVSVGKLSAADTLPLRAEVSLRTQDLIDARSARHAQRIRLARLLGAPLSDDRLGESLSSTAEVHPKPLTDLASHLSLARQLRGDLNEARLRIERGELQTIVTRNGLLPRLDLFMTLGKSGYAASFSDAASDFTGGSYDLLVGMELSQAIGARAAAGRHRAAQLESAQAEASVRNLLALVELDVRIAATELERVRQQVEASAETRALRAQLADAEAERVKVGASTPLQLALAQRDLLQSQIAEVEAMVGYRLALVELYRAEGSLLDRRGIRMPSAEPPPQ